MLRRPEQVCFCRSTSLDGPNKFVFADPQASTPSNKFVFPDPRASTLPNKDSGGSGNRYRVPGCTRDFDVVVARTAVYSVVRCDRICVDSVKGVHFRTQYVSKNRIVRVRNYSVLAPMASGQKRSVVREIQI